MNILKIIFLLFVKNIISNSERVTAIGRRKNQECLADEIALRDEILELKKQIVNLKRANEQNLIKLKKYEDEAKSKDRQIEQLMDPRKNGDITKILSTKGAALLMNLKDQNNSLLQMILAKDMQIRRLVAEIKTAKLYGSGTRGKPDIHRPEMARLRAILAKSQEFLRENLGIRSQSNGTEGSGDRKSIYANGNSTMDMSPKSDQFSPREVEELRLIIQTLETYVKYSNDLLARKNQEIMNLRQALLAERANYQCQGCRNSSSELNNYDYNYSSFHGQQQSPSNWSQFTPEKQVPHQVQASCDDGTAEICTRTVRIDDPYEKAQTSTAFDRVTTTPEPEDGESSGEAGEETKVQVEYKPSPTGKMTPNQRAFQVEDSTSDTDKTTRTAKAVQVEENTSPSEDTTREQTQNTTQGTANATTTTTTTTREQSGGTSSKEPVTIDRELMERWKEALKNGPRANQRTERKRFKKDIFSSGSENSGSDTDDEAGGKSEGSEKVSAGSSVHGKDDGGGGGNTGVTTDVPSETTGWITTGQASSLDVDSSILNDNHSPTTENVSGKSSDDGPDARTNDRTVNSSSLLLDVTRQALQEEESMMAVHDSDDDDTNCDTHHIKTKIRGLASTAFPADIQRELNNLYDSITTYEEVEAATAASSGSRKKTFANIGRNQSFDSSLESDYGYPKRQEPQVVQVQVEINTVKQSNNYYDYSESQTNKNLNQTVNYDYNYDDYYDDDDDDDDDVVTW